MSKIIYFKSYMLFVFIGIFTLYSLSNVIIIKASSISYLTILALAVLAIIVTIISFSLSFLEETKCPKLIYLLIKGLLYLLLGFIANLIYPFYSLKGVAYLYYLLGIIFLYIGFTFAQYFLKRLDIKEINALLKNN